MQLFRLWIGAWSEAHPQHSQTDSEYPIGPEFKSIFRNKVQIGDTEQEFGGLSTEFFTGELRVVPLSGSS